MADRTKTIVPVQVPALRRLLPFRRNSRAVPDDRDRVTLHVLASFCNANTHDVLPAHSLAEVEALRASLRVSGIITPLIVDEAQNIIDGRKRAQLWQELGYRADDVFKQAVGCSIFGTRVRACTTSGRSRSSAGARANNPCG